jgi:hypothetical protein
MRLAGSEKEWNIMWNLYLNETDAQERIKLLHGLAYSSEPWILQRSGKISKKFKGISLWIPSLNDIFNKCIRGTHCKVAASVYPHYISKHLIGFLSHILFARPLSLRHSSNRQAGGSPLVRYP